MEHLTDDLLREKTAAFLGEITQMPPVFSAVKKDGKRLYEYARAGKEVEIPLRRVQIHDFQLSRIALPEVDFSVTCSKGTYIRSLAHDFGKAVGSGAYLAALKRTKIGSFNVDTAMSPDEFRALFVEAGYRI
jgi:tRNA pseudouridine55 synthase